LPGPAIVLRWRITLAGIALISNAFVVVDARSHSVSDALYVVLPYWGVAFLLWDWLARWLSRTKDLWSALYTHRHFAVLRQNCLRTHEARALTLHS
jgi:hypothetical protein